MWSHCMAPSPWTTLWCPMAFQGKKNQETVKLVLPAVPWVTGFFVSDSGISSQNPCNCVGYLVNSLEGGKMNSFWYGNNMQTMNDFSLSLVLYNAIYVFWALIFSFGNLHKNLCLKKIMLRIKWGVMWAAETISYSAESILSFSYTRGTLFYSSGHQSQEKKYIFQPSLQVSGIKQWSSQWYMSRGCKCNFQLAWKEEFSSLLLPSFQLPGI